MKKGDIVIIGAIAAMLVLSIVLLFPFSNHGSRVIIKQNGTVIYDEDIGIDKTVDIKTNTIVIKDGSVYISHAACKNQVCVNTGKISKKGESIVCLPNKVTVEIE